MAKLFGYGSPADFFACITDLGTQVHADASNRDKIMTIFREKGVVNDLEIKVYRKDGTTINVSINCHAIKDNNQEIIRLESTIIDISEKKRIAQELTKHQEHLEEMVEERTRKMEQANKEFEDANKKLVNKINELERFTKQVAGRELRMIDLKKEINGLLKETKKTEKYKIAQ